METAIDYYFPEKNSFFRKRYNSSGFLLAGLLLFFLPFVNLRCMNKTVMSSTGISHVTGGQWKLSDAFSSMVKTRFGDEMMSRKDSKSLRVKPNPCGIVAYLAAFMAMLLPFFEMKWRHKAGMYMAGAAGVAMLGLLIYFKLKAGFSPASGQSASEMASISRVVEIRLSIWFFLATAMFAAAAFCCYKHWKYDRDDELLLNLEFESAPIEQLSETDHPKPL